MIDPGRRHRGTAGTQSEEEGRVVRTSISETNGSRRMGRGTADDGADGIDRVGSATQETAVREREINECDAGPFASLGRLSRVSENGVTTLKWLLPESLLRDDEARKVIDVAWRRRFQLHDDYLREPTHYDSDRGEMRLKGDDWQFLDEWLGRFQEGPMAEDAFAVARGLAHALDAAAAKNAIPQHLCPRAIRIEMRAVPGKNYEAPEPLLEEFVVTDIVRDLLSARGIAARDLPGEAEWRAPELARPGAKATARSCQWTLARLLYTMLKGKAPDTASPQSIRKLDARRNGAFRRALSTDPEKRFATCSDFVEMAETGHIARVEQKTRRIVFLSIAIVLVGAAVAAWQIKRVISERPDPTEIATVGQIEELPENKLSETAERRLAEALAAKSDGRWADCLSAAKDVVAEASWHAQARALADEAEMELRPSLKIEADKPGAWIVRKGEKVRLPTRIWLEPGSREGPWDVTATSGGETWSAFVPEFMVDNDWSGMKMRRVILSRGETGTGVAKKRRTVTLPDGKKFTMIWCPPGTFEFGEAGDSRKVRLTKGFWLSEKELTIGEWKSLRSRTPSSIVKWNNKLKTPVLKDIDVRPIDNVSWEDCQSFIKELNDSGCDLDLEFRLPTEAEWEYACRAGTNGDFAGDIEKMAWFNKTAKYVRVTDNNTNVAVAEIVAPQPVGTKVANPWGFCDMHGNVSEWCADAWDGGWWQRQPSGLLVDPKGPSQNERHVVRGGYVGSARSDCASYVRQGLPEPENGLIQIVNATQKEDGQYVNIGFRLAADDE